MCRNRRLATGDVRGLSVRGKCPREKCPTLEKTHTSKRVRTSFYTVAFKAHSKLKSRERCVLLTKCVYVHVVVNITALKVTVIST